MHIKYTSAQEVNQGVTALFGIIVLASLPKRNSALLVPLNSGSHIHMAGSVGGLMWQRVRTHEHWVPQDSGSVVLPWAHTLPEMCHVPLSLVSHFVF